MTCPTSGSSRDDATRSPAAIRMRGAYHVETPPPVPTGWRGRETQDENMAFCGAGGGLRHGHRQDPRRRDESVAGDGPCIVAERRLRPAAHRIAGARAGV